MNRKDFETIGRAIKKLARPAHDVQTIANTLADAIAAADGCSGFDRGKFLKLCGVTHVER